MEIGTLIKNFRKKNSLTQKDFGSLIDVCGNTISIWERGKSSPNFLMKEKIFNVIGIDQQRKPIINQNSSVADKKFIQRNLFQLKVYKYNGQTFENFFTEIMSYAFEEFTQIKPWGNIGDRGNDGCIPNEGKYYQVYAPEDPKSSYPNVIKKLENDFKKLKKHWNVKKFYFVFNDKYAGINADCILAMQRIKEDNSLQEGQFFTAKNLEKIFFHYLQEDEISQLIGSIPDPLNLKNLNYNVLTEVVEHIMTVPLNRSTQTNINPPDFEKKITFNKLSVGVTQLINNSYIHMKSLNDYLSNQPDFFSQKLRNHINEIYLEEKAKHKGDELFWSIVDRISYKDQQAHQTSSIVVMSKYFETCDIFEEPPRRIR